MRKSTFALLLQIQKVKNFLQLSSQINCHQPILCRNVYSRRRDENCVRSTNKLPSHCSLCHAQTRNQSTSTSMNTHGAERWIYSSDFKPDIDKDYITSNIQAVAENISHRKGTVDVNDILEKLQDVKQLQAEVHGLEKKIEDGHIKQEDVSKLKHLLQEQTVRLHEAESAFYQLAVALPNKTHPDVPLVENAEPVLIEEVGEKTLFEFPIKGHMELGENLDIIRTRNLGHVTGHRSYFLKGAGAMLEDALTRFAMDRLTKEHKFTALRVPDIIRPVVFEGCGMRTEGLHTQVYRLSPEHHPHLQDLCLAGTAEVGIAGFFMNRTLSLKDLPIKVAAMSRCFRAETAHSAEARGLYRVHQFTKVEMYGLTADETGEESEQLFHEFVNIQRALFQDLELHFQILDMPAHDLGAPAYRKFDMEAWMPHRNSYGEISSTSNCTDFQSRRLNIQYTSQDNGKTKYVHTLNGTACAVPRMIIAILENFQQRDGSIVIPHALRPYMNGMKKITQPASGFLHYTRL